MQENKFNRQVLEALRLSLQEFAQNAPVLAIANDFPLDVCEELFQEKLIAGYVLPVQPAAENKNSLAVGWWINRVEGVWQLNKTNTRDLLLVGAQSQVGGRMLMEARRAGFRTLHLVLPGSKQIKRLNVTASIAKIFSTRAIEKLARNPLIHKTVSVAMSSVSNVVAIKTPTFEKAFEQFIADIGDSLRLDPSQFVDEAVMMVIGSLGPGGAERQLTNTAMGLSDQGTRRLSVLSINVAGSAGFHTKSLEDAGVGVTELDQSAIHFEDERVQMALKNAASSNILGFHRQAELILAYAAEMRRQKPGVAQLWMDYCNVLGGIAAQLVGVPRIILCGRSLAPDNFDLSQPFMKPGYEALLKHRPDAIFTNNSLAGAKDYSRWLSLPLSRFEVINNGFQFPNEDFSDKAKALRDQFVISADAKLVGSVLRFSEEKQPFLWVETAQKVLAKKPDAIFIAFGTGVLFDKVKAQIEAKGLSNCIILPGVTLDVWSALTAMDIFLLTSRLEGLPNVLIEAQAMGVPVVTTGRGGMQETYIEDETGFTATTATATELASTIITLIDNDEIRETAGKRAKVYVREQFSVERMLDSTQQIFEKH